MSFSSPRPVTLLGLAPVTYHLLGTGDHEDCPA
jgi:hypothetical protein